MFPVCELYQVPATDYQRITIESIPSQASSGTFNQEEFRKAVFARLFAITVPAQSKDAVLSLISKLQTVLDGLILQAAGGLFTECVIDTVNVVGQYQKDTAVRGPRETEGDMVILIGSLPSTPLLNSLGQKIVADLKHNYPSEDFSHGVSANEVIVGSIAAQVHIHVVPVDPSLLDNAECEFTLKQFVTSMRLVDQANWFASNAPTASVKSLVRLLLDLRERYPAFRILGEHAMDVLAKHCITLTNGPPLSIEQGFRRFMELISMNILLRKAWPTTELFASDEPDMNAKISASRLATDLLCQLAQGDFKTVLQSSVLS